MPLDGEPHPDRKGYWVEDPRYPIDDWRYQVANHDTLEGYWEWAQNKHEEEQEEDEDAS